MNEVNQTLTDPDLSPTKLEKYYKELGEINTVLAARDAERRLRTSASHKERKR